MNASDDNRESSIQAHFLERGILQFHNAQCSSRDVAAMFSSLELFQRELQDQSESSGILKTVHRYLSGFRLFQTTAFYTVSADSFFFELNSCSPETAREQILALIKKEIANGHFAWSLKQSRAVTFPDETEKGRQIVFHSMCTRSRTIGMFVGLLINDDPALRKPLLSLLSLMIASTVHVIENNLLQEELREHARNLESTVEARTSELKTANEELVHEIELRREVEADLVRARDTANSANKAKSEFLAAMSHEIRTPMNAILGMTDLTLQTPLDGEQQDNLMTIKESAQNLLMIINDILDFSKIEAGRIEIETIDFDLDYMLDSTLRSLEIQARNRGCVFELKRDTFLPRYLNGDPLRLRQILINLLGNAIKFSENSPIILEVRQCRPGLAEEEELLKSALPEGDIPLVFSVSDNGIGIPQDKQMTIFDSFSQADGSTTRKYGGSGLGLAICRRLTSLMHGQIWVESEPGKGSTFSFTARLGPGRPVAAEPPVEKGRATFSGEPANGNQRTAGTVSLAQLKVLLVEDNAMNRKVGLRMIDRLGHNGAAAEDGANAISMLQSARFDIVLMDVEMPDEDGLQVTRRIRQGEGGKLNSTIPIAAMTAHALTEMREQCLGAGMNDFITKPVDFYDLGNLINRLAPVTESVVRQKSSDHTKSSSASNKQSLLNVRKALIRMGGDEEMLHDFMGTFQVDTQEIRDRIAESIQSRDWPMVNLDAHTLKSMAGIIGAEALAEVSESLETVSGRGDAAAILDLYHRAEQLIKATLAEIPRHLEQAGG